MVVFRKWKMGSRFRPYLLALFPFEDFGHGLCMSYETVGQHGGADYFGCIRDTRPAKPAEYLGLAAELRGIGYRLLIRSRRPRRPPARKQTPPK